MEYDVEAIEALDWLFQDYEAHEGECVDDIKDDIAIMIKMHPYVPLEYHKKANQSLGR